MLDRMGLSVKNRWFDDENKVYIIYTLKNIMEDFGCADNKATKLLKELDKETGIGLIERKRQGLGKPDIIYVKSFVITPEVQHESGIVKITTQEPSETQVQNSENHDSGTVEITSQGSLKSRAINTNINNTNLSENKSNHIVSADGMGSEEDEMETLHAYQSLIKENLDYDSLLVSHPHDKNQIDEIVDLIVETVMCKSDKVLIASNWYSGALVRGKFMKLDYSHVEYVLHCLEGNTSKIKNIKKYLLAALFNAPSTISGYYRAEVNHDMPWLAR